MVRCGIVYRVCGAENGDRKLAVVTDLKRFQVP
jgi:hypothetical protein